ncbi:PIN domain-containing protein [Ensifer sp. ENS05]|uniref:PIN domain-containing protein n=1 Tax=Ensifer sp. ENS05 TaxID=2769277 RepID=UPI0017873FF3|nr:PIN domain-containing protein [Ensifer sp. ENS05]
MTWQLMNVVSKGLPPMPDRILLDTNLIAEAQKPRPHPDVAAWFASLEGSMISIPFPTIFETEYGIRLKQPEDPQRALRLLVWLEGLLSTDYHYPEITVDVARLYARMAACPPLKHFWYPDLSPDNKRRRVKFGCDPMIAAISICHKTPIASLNVRDFLAVDEYFPVPGLYNPASRAWAIDPPVGWSFRTNANDDAEARTNVLRFNRTT